MPIVAYIVFRSESIRRASRLSDITLVADLPIEAAQAFIPVMTHYLSDQRLPLIVVIWIHHILVGFWKQHLRLDSDAHQWHSAGPDDFIDRLIESVKVIASSFRSHLDPPHPGRFLETTPSA